MKKLFHPGLFVESLHQLRLIGWMAFLVFTLESILIPIYRLNESSANALIREGAFEIHPLMIAVFLAVAPLMVLYLFNFLNKRSGSDYYHAIPVTRTAMFVSMTMAVLAWCVFLIVSGYAIAVLFRLCFGYRFMAYLNLLKILIYMGGLALKCIWMIGLSAIAVSVTGTGFTNVAVLLLLLFGPRALVYVLTDAVYGTIPFLADSSMTLSSFFSRFYDATSHMGSTLALGVGYWLLAAVLFYFRKSEMAGQAAPNRVVQTVFRLMIPTLLSVWVTVSSCTPDGNVYDWTEMITVYAISLVLYLLYELVTTRKWRNVARALPGLLILVALNYAALGGVKLACRMSTAFQPAAGEIVAVQQIRTKRSSDDYFRSQVSRTKLTDAALCDLLAESVTTQTKAWVDNPTRYREKYGYQSDWVVIRLYDARDRAHTRKIALSSAAASALQSAYEKDAPLLERLRRFPDASSVTLSMRFLDWQLDESVGAAVYEAFRSEIAEKSYSELVEILDWKGTYNQDQMIVSMKVGPETYTQQIPLDPTVLPKTYQAFTVQTADYNRTQQAEIAEKLAAYVAQTTDDSDREYYFSVYIDQPDGTTESAFWTPVDSDAKQNAKQLLEIIRQGGDPATDGTARRYYVCLECNSRNGNGTMLTVLSRNGAAYVLPDAQAQQLQTLIASVEKARQTEQSN